MTNLRKLLGLALVCVAPLLAQPGYIPLPPPPAADQLETLVSPIALYPDPLISIILPASTMPGDIALAARFTRTTNDPVAIDNQTWDESVRAVAHYPELVTWLDENLEWTKQLGAAFATDPAEVMNTIQRLRQRAREAGILVDTPQQSVIVQQQYIYIVPAQPNVIYVPSYDPGIFYSSYGYSRPRSTLSFSLAFSTGPWLAFEPDWGRRSIWIDRRRDWSQRNWRPAPTNVVVSAERQAWRPRADVAARLPAPTSRTTINNNVTNTTRVEIVQPTPLAATRSSSSATTSAAPAPADNRDGRTRPTAQTPPPPAEPALAPTGREAAPVAAPAPQRDRDHDRDQVRERDRTRDRDRESVSTPIAPPPSVPPAESRGDRGRGREVRPDVRPSEAPVATPRAAPPPQASPRSAPPVTRPAPPNTPATKAPPPQAKSDQPEPKGKAKGKDKDDDNEEDDDTRKRGK
jgi:hypothetical protein